MTEAVSVKFTSKDPQLAEHYDRTFRELFEAQWRLVEGATEGEQEGIKAGWRLAMYAEARRQEHYDYIVNDRGVRELIYDTARRPKLLIPDIEVG